MSSTNTLAPALPHCQVCLSSSSIFYSPPNHCITAIYIYIHLFLSIIYKYYNFYIYFYIHIYISIHIYIYYIYLTLSLFSLLLIKRVSFKIQVSQPAVTDDSYLRTDVKPPKLGKGALQYICFFYMCTFANARLSSFALSSLHVILIYSYFILSLFSYEL